MEVRPHLSRERPTRRRGAVLSMGVPRAWPRLVSGLLVASLIGLPLASLGAQRVGGPSALTSPRFPLSGQIPLEPAHGAVPSPAPVAPASWWAPVASLAVPGAGQSLLKQPRSVAYLAAEAFLVIQYLGAERDGNRQRAEYRRLAAEVARKSFNGSSVGSWDYYESMEKFLESGAFDMTPGGAVNPETDPTTYNGARWLLARQNFWANPDVAPDVASTAYQRAMAFYLASAVTESFRWSWRDQQLQQDLYRQSIRGANRSYQRATNLLGIVAMNHLGSLIDAYMSVRVRRFGEARPSGLSGVRLDGVTTGYALTPGGDGQFLIGVRAR